MVYRCLFWAFHTALMYATYFFLHVVPSYTLYACECPCRCKDEFSVDRAKKIEEIRALEGLSPEDKLEKVRVPLRPALSLSLSLYLSLSPCTHPAIFWSPSECVCWN